MPDYVIRALEKFKHNRSKRVQHAPHQWIKPTYGQKVHYALPPSTLPTLIAVDTKYIQSIDGPFLYYGRAVDPCILPAYN